MKLINPWLKKYWKDNTFRSMTYGILGGAIAFQILSYLVNWELVFPQAITFFWGIYILIVLPVCYLNRNTK